MQGTRIARVLGFILLACAACGGNDAANNKDAASNGAIAGGAGAGSASSALMLPTGTTIQASIQEPISSGSNTTGQHIKAVVSRNVTDGARVVIPGGAAIVLTIAQLRPANSSGTVDGTVTVDVASVALGDTTYTPSAKVGPVPHQLKPGPATTANRDVIVTPGTPITITLTQPLRISAK